MEIEGWEPVTGATNQTGDHLRFQLRVGDDILRTRISHPPSAKHTYGPHRWHHTLRDQLKVTEEEFWACVKDGKLPVRSQPTVVTREGTIPVEVVNLLIHRVGLDENEVRSMSKQEAIERLTRYWAGEA